MPTSNIKKTCFLCLKETIKQADENKEKDIEKNIEKSLIYPCFCNKMSHRKCLRNYIITNCEMGCGKCRTNYAIGSSRRYIINHLKPKLISSLLWKVFKVFGVSLINAVIIIYLSKLDDLNDFENKWRLFLYSICSILFFLILAYFGLLMRIFCLNLGTKDIEIYCNQTEIAKHNKNSKEILKDFLEKIHLNNYNLSGIENEEKKNSSHLEEENLSIHKGIKSKERIEHESQIKDNQKIDHAWTK